MSSTTIREPFGRRDFPHFQRHNTRWNDNDVYGHLNNTVHYALFDSTVNSWLMSRGLLDPAGSASIGLVVETGCRYLTELGFPAPVDAGLRVAHVGRSSVRYELALFADGSEQPAAVGFFVHVYVDRTTRRPCPIPETTRNGLAALVV